MPRSWGTCSGVSTDRLKDPQESAIWERVRELWTWWCGANRTMQRTLLGAPVILGAAFAVLVMLAPAALAGEFDLGGPCDDLDLRVKFGASGQAYSWRSGGC